MSRTKTKSNGNYMPSIDQCGDCMEMFNGQIIPTKCQHCGIFRCSSCFNNHRNCASKVAFNFPDPNPKRKRKPDVIIIASSEGDLPATADANVNSKASKSTAIIVESQTEDDSFAIEEANQDGAMPLADLTLVVGDANSQAFGSNTEMAAKTNEDESAAVENGASLLVDLSSAEKISDDDDENHNDDEEAHGHDCTSCSQVNSPTSNRYRYSEESEVLVKVMPEKFSKGFGVIQEKSTNQTWIAGQAYKKKEGATHWIFVQGLQLLDEALKDNSSIDQINFVFASYDCVMDFLTLRSTPENYEWKLDIAPASDSKEYLQIPGLQHPSLEEMESVIRSIGSTLKAKRAAALKGVVNSSSSTSSNESTKSLSDDEELQQIGVISLDAEDYAGSTLQVKEKRKNGATLNNAKKRAGSRIKKANKPFTIENWKSTSSNKRGQTLPALSEEWQSAINEWESLSMCTYHREKGEKLKTLQKKTEKLKKEMADARKGGLSRARIELEKEKQKQKQKEEEDKNEKESAAEKKRQKVKEQELENEIERLKKRERERELLEKVNNNDTKNTTTVVVGKTGVQKTTEDMIDILKGASSLKKIIYKANKEEIKQNKNLALKQNDMNVTKLGHDHKVAIMHADQRVLIQSYDTPRYKSYSSERERYKRRERSRSRSWSRESEEYYYSRHESESNKRYKIRSSERDSRSHRSQERQRHEVDEKWSRKIQSDQRGHRFQSSQHRRESRSRSRGRDIDSKTSRDVRSDERDRRFQSSQHRRESRSRSRGRDIDSKHSRSDAREHRNESNRKRREPEINEHVYDIRYEERGHRTKVIHEKRSMEMKEQSRDDRTNERGHRYESSQKSREGKDKYELSGEIRSDDRGRLFEMSHEKRSRELKEKYHDNRYDERGDRAHRCEDSKRQYIAYEIKRTKSREKSEQYSSSDSSSGRSSPSTTRTYSGDSNSNSDSSSDTA